MPKKKKNERKKEKRKKKRKRKGKRKERDKKEKRYKGKSIKREGAIQGVDLKWTQAAPPPYVFAEIGRLTRLTLCGRIRQKRERERERMHQIVRID